MALIALIDDDPDILETMDLILSSGGYEVLSASSMEEGYDLIKARTPDLIILDVMMEEPADGFFLAQRIKKEGLSAPIIMYSAVGRTTGMSFSKGGLVAVDLFLEKPVSPEELLKSVENLLNRGSNEKL